MPKELDNIINQRKILKANYNLTNKIDYDEFIDLAIETLNTVKESLYKSYGKYATNTLVIYESTSNVSVFTTDGIHKLQALEFISPIQTYIAEHIKYVGECVEKQAKDGTTTAMIFVCDLMQQLFKKMKNIKGKYLIKYFEDHSLDYTPEQTIQFFISNLSDQLINVLSILKKFTKLSIIKLQDLSEKDRHLYISNIIDVTAKSHAPIIKESIMKIIDKMPPEFYNYFSYIRSEIETDKLISIEEKKYDYTTDIILTSGHKYFNKNSKTTFKEKNVQLLIFPCNVDNSNVEIRNKIDKTLKALSDKTFLVLLYKSINTSYLLELENIYKTKKIIFLQYIHHVPDIYESCIELDGLIVGSKNSNNNNLIKKLDVKIEFGILYINNIFKYDKKSSYVNYKYYTKNKNPLQTWESELKELIYRIKHQYKKTDVNILVKEYTYLYKKIIIPKYPNLLIGGKTLEHLELVDVIEDTIGSLSSIFKYGVIDNYYVQVLHYIKSISYDNVKTKGVFNLSSTYINQLIKDIIYNIFVTLNENRLADNNIRMLINSKSLLEMYDRAVDIIPRFIKTTEIIIPGTINVDLDKK